MNTNWNQYVRRTPPGRPLHEWKPLALKVHGEGKTRPAYPAEAIRRILGITWMRLVDLSRAGILPLMRKDGVWMIPDFHVFAYFDPDEVWDGEIVYTPDLTPSGI